MAPRTLCLSSVDGRTKTPPMKMMMAMVSMTSSPIVSCTFPIYIYFLVRSSRTRRSACLVFFPFDLANMNIIMRWLVVAGDRRCRLPIAGHSQSRNALLWNGWLASGDQEWTTGRQQTLKTGQGRSFARFN